VRHRRHLGDQRLAVEWAYGEALRPTGAKRMHCNVHGHGQTVGAHHLSDDLAPAPGTVPVTVQEKQWHGISGHDHSLNGRLLREDDTWAESSRRVRLENCGKPEGHLRAATEVPNSPEHHNGKQRASVPPALSGPRRPWDITNGTVHK